MSAPGAEPIGAPKEAPKKMPAGASEPPAKGGASLNPQFDLTPVGAPQAQPIENDSRIPF